MSASPIHFTESATVEFLVERTLSTWASRLPFVGFTCTTPQEVQCKRCFFGPSPHAFCLGESVTIGGTGEAWLRLGNEPCKPGIGQRLEENAQRKMLLPSIPEHRRCAPVTLRAGDRVGCRYQHLPPGGDEERLARSAIALFVNGRLAVEFEFDGQLPEKPLYAVVDVCYSVYQVSLTSIPLPSEECVELDDGSRLIGG